MASSQIHSEFQNIISLLMKKKTSNLVSIQILTNLRDVLLPKLISGELRVPEAEKMLEEIGI